MPGLLIKDLSPEIHRRLKERAARNKRSMRKEALFILEKALLEDEAATRELPPPIQGQYLLTDEWIDAAKQEGRE